MGKNTLFVGLDVHAKSINVAVAEFGRDGDVRSLGAIPNDSASIQKMITRLRRKHSDLRVCYEAGPCGYVVYWQMVGLDVQCEVVAPSLIPKKPGTRVKTDRLDAIQLAKCHRSGDLTAVWVPDADHEALRDLVRAREAAAKDLRSARHRLSKFLLRHDVRKPEGVSNWSQKYFQWIRGVDMGRKSLDFVFQDYLCEVDNHRDRIQRIEKEIDSEIANSPDSIQQVVAALQLLRGIAKTTAAGLVAEIGNFSRFSHPEQLMSYVGVVPSEYSSGGPGKRNTGGITRTGNGHARRLVIEAGWNYRFRPNANERMKRCEKQVQEKFLPEIKSMATKAQRRLCDRYRTLSNKGKPKQVVVTAVGRELLGHIWAIATHVERNTSATCSDKEKRTA